MKQIGLIGCGLMGGSLALALKEHGMVKQVIGYSPHTESTTLALQLGVIDQVTNHIADVCKGSDLVIVATPVAQVASVMAALRPTLQPTTWLMDVGSTKARLITQCRAVLGHHMAQWVPTHPIAGSEQSGVAAARSDLYRHQNIILTPTPETASWALNQAEQLWQTLESKVHHMSPDDHDAAYAGVSHLPHLLAFAMMRSLTEQPQGHEWLALAGSGFRDFTRIAASDPIMWRDILLENPHIATQTQSLVEQLNVFLNWIATGDGVSLAQAIAEVRQTRSRLFPATAPQNQ